MDKNFIPKELIHDVIKLGFDGECSNYYVKGNEIWKYIRPYSITYLKQKKQIPALKYTQVFDFFKRKLKVDIVINKTITGKYWCFKIQKQYVMIGCGFANENGEFYQTLSEVKIECLKQLIKLLKNK